MVVTVDLFASVRVLCANRVQNQPNAAYSQGHIFNVFYAGMVRDCMPCSISMGYEPEGREFESLRARHDFKDLGHPVSDALAYCARIVRVFHFPARMAITFRSAVLAK